MIKVTEILQVLSDTTRLRLLRLLAGEELSVAELQEILEMGQSRISSHLSQIRRHGRFNLGRSCSTTINDILNFWIQLDKTGKKGTFAQILEARI